MRKLLMVSALALGLAVIAPAATLGPYSETFSLTATPWSTDLFLPAFDSSLGTLTGVTLELDGLMEGEVFLQSFASGGAFTLGAESELVLYSFDGITPLMTVNPTASIVGTVAPGSFFSDFVSNSAADSLVFTAPADLAAFMIPGGGLLSALQMTAEGGGFATTAFNPFSAGATIFSEGTVRLTYEYSRIPEPSTWALMLSGVGLLAVSRLRRRR